MSKTKLFNFPEGNGNNDLATLLALNGNNNGVFGTAWLQGYIMRRIIQALKDDG